jgi:hypothetical protein
LTRLLRYQEAADILGISRSALGRAIACGQLQPIQAPGTTGHHGRRISSDQVEALMVPPEPEPTLSPPKLLRRSPLRQEGSVERALKRVMDKP